jgi:hypothetical protein
MRLRWVGLVVIVVALACAGPATAATRYASPNGGETGNCATPQTACGLNFAIGQAAKGDEVIVQSGTYVLPHASPTSNVENLYVHGDLGGPMPVVEAKGLGAAMVLGPAGDKLAWMEVISEGVNSSGALCSNHDTLERVRLISTGIQARGALEEGGCELVDSLLVARGENSDGTIAGPYSGNEKMRIVDSTVIASGLGSVGVRATGEAFSVELADTIASGDMLDLLAEDKTLSLTASHSNFDSAQAQNGATFTSGAGNQSAPPLFTNAAANDYSEAIGSPTIDAGLAVPGVTPALDLAGNPRVVGAGLDIGAYEYVPPVVPPPVAPLQPIAKAAPPSIANLKLNPNQFRVPGKGVVKGKGPAIGTTITFSLSAASRVAFTVERKTRGRRVGKSCVRRTRGNAEKPTCPLYLPVTGSFAAAGKAGSNSVRFEGKLAGKALAPGLYRLDAKAGPATASAPFAIVR